MAIHRVLVTGAAGTIGQPVCRELRARGHVVRGFDRTSPAQPIDGLESFRVGDIKDRQALREAASGMDTIIHLAACPDPKADFTESLLEPNVLGVFEVLEAARLLNVKRVVVTSSVQVIFGLPWRERMIGVDEPLVPQSHYAVTKVLAEAWGRMYDDQFGLSVIVARPGWVPRTSDHIEAIAAEEAFKNIYFSPGDAGRFFACCVEAENVPFAVLFGASRPYTRPTVDLEPARRLVGYEPRDTWSFGRA